MTTTETPNPLRELWVPQLLMGLVAVAVGVLVLMWPGVSILAASVLLGVYRVLLFITGAVSLVLGVLAFRHFGQGYAVLLLAVWIGVGFIFQGVAATALAISYRDLPGRGWFIFFGVLSMIAGIVVLAWPFDSIIVLALVTGIMLVLIGITQVLSSFGTRHDLRTAEKRVSRVVPGAPTQAA